MIVQDEIDTAVLLLPNGAPIIEGGDFPEDSFPPVMMDYARSLSATYAVPVPLFLGMMLGAISGAAGKGWRLTGAAEGFGNYANLFLLFALETGSHKSIVSAIIKPITEEQQKRMDNWKLQELPVIKAHLKKYEKEQAKLAPDASQNERNTVAKEIAFYEEKLKHSPALMLGSTTTAALAANLQHMEQETAFLFSPEAGDLVRVALGLYRESGMDADLLLSGFTGEPFTQNRVGSGNIDVRTPCISLLGMVQPCVVREVLAHKEAKERGLLNRILFIPLGYPTPLDDGNRPPLDTQKEQKWWVFLENILRVRLKGGGTPQPVECSPEAKEVFRGAHNESVGWRNGEHQDLAPWVARYRELISRVALCLHLGTSTSSRQLTQETALGAVALVRWCVGQLVEMLHESRSGALKARLQDLAAAVPGEGFVTLRDLKRAGFTEPEVKQLCALSEGELVYWVHEAERGGTPSPRVSLRSERGSQ